MPGREEHCLDCSGIKTDIENLKVKTKSWDDDMKGIRKWIWGSLFGIILIFVTQFMTYKRTNIDYQAQAEAFIVELEKRDK